MALRQLLSMVAFSALAVLPGCSTVGLEADAGAPLTNISVQQDPFVPGSGANRALQPSSDPTLAIQLFELSSSLPHLDAWQEVGFEDPELFQLTPQYAQDAVELPLSLPPMTFIVFRDSGWDRSALMSTVRDLPKRYATCGIKISPILVVETQNSDALSARAGGLSFKSLGVDDYDRLSPLLGSLPTSARPLFFFVESIFSVRYQDTVGGFAANVYSEFGAARLPLPGRRSQIAQTGALARKPADNDSYYRFDQTISHEIGHLLGLRHVPQPADGTENIMTALTCEDCDFSARQCAEMRESRLLSPAT